MKLWPFLLVFAALLPIWLAGQEPPIQTLSINQCIQQALANGPDAQLAGFTWQQDQLIWAETQAQNGLSLSTGAGYAPSTSTKGNNSLSTGSASTLQFNNGDLQFNPVNHNLNANLTLTGPLTSVKLGATQVIPGDNPSNQNTELGVTVTQTVFDGMLGGKAAGNLEQARLQLEIQHLSWQDSLNTVAYNVRQAALTLIGTQRILEAKQAGYDTLKSESDRTALFLKSGMATALDASQAKTAAETARLDVQSAQNDLDSARRSLSLLMGWPADQEFQLEDLSTTTAALPDRQTVLATAMANRNELKSWQLSRQSSEIDLKLKEAATLPTINLSGTVNWRHDWAASSQNALALNGGANVAFTLADGGNNKSLIQAGKATLATSNLQKQQIIATITTDINTALFAVRDSLDRRTLAQNSLDDSKAAWDQAQLKLQAGLATHLDVLTALVSWTQAKSALTTAMNNVESAWLKLYQAQGLSL